MKKLSMRTKVIIFGLITVGLINMNIFTDYWAGADYALIREMRLVSKPSFGKYKEDLDDVVLKHIPLGTTANVALEICQKNGFKAERSKDMKGAAYPGFEEKIVCLIKETRWYLISTDEYQVFIYLKNNQVGAVVGRFFARTFE
jgi:hypothetical protein